VINVKDGIIQLLLVLLAMMDGLFQVEGVHQVVQAVPLNHKLIVEAKMMVEILVEILVETHQIVISDKFLLVENVLM